MDIIYFDLILKDILFVILSYINKELIYPLLFVSKKFNKYIKDTKIIYNKKCLDEIVKIGSLNLVKWARENGCLWNFNICSLAAKNGHFEILKWARENGCEWDSWTCTSA